MSATVKSLMYKAIVTRFVCPTNCRGSRYSASDGDGNRVLVDGLSALGAEENHKAAAEALCRKMNWTGDLAGGYIKGGCAFVFIDGPKPPRR
jgi:hypothetical protein